MLRSDLLVCRLAVEVYSQLACTRLPGRIPRQVWVYVGHWVDLSWKFCRDMRIFVVWCIVAYNLVHKI